MRNGGGTISLIEAQRAASARARVLVVDDEERNRSLVRGYLDGEHEVLEAADAEAAYRILGSTPIDVVLLDVMMPGTSGLEACRRIKESAKEFLPVLLLTALAEQDDRNAGLEAGADDFLTKPVDRRELRLRVRAFLRLRSQERLIRSQLDEIRVLDAFKDDLVSLLVHDLRNPLAGLLGFLSVIQREASDPLLLDDVRAAASAADKLRAMVEDLLEVRRLEEGRLALDSALQRLRPILDDAATTVAGDARDRGVHLQVSGEATLVATVDGRLLRRALENLLANAVKYAPRGSAVSLDAAAVGSALEITVADLGPGIPAAVRTHLFEKFGSVEAQRDRQLSGRRGFGLGLYLVRLVAQSFGGDVTAEDRAGGGTVLRLRLSNQSAGP